MTRIIYKCSYVSICSVLLWMHRAIGFGCLPSLLKGTTRQSCKLSQQHTPEIWIQEAEAGFVDEEENLEEGEICHRSVKAFASSVATSILPIPRFLCAGALVQRPGDSPVCDAWTADSILDEGGPNLQLQGACRILDDLLLFHLRRQHHEHNDEIDDDSIILRLQTFVVKCGSGSESEYSCASYMAAVSRGFRPLKEMIRKSSIYSSVLYDNDVDGLVMDVNEGKRNYETLSEQEGPDSTASSILHLLPDDDAMRRHTTKRFTLQQSLNREWVNDRKLP